MLNTFHVYDDSSPEKDVRSRKIKATGMFYKNGKNLDISVDLLCKIIKLPTLTHWPSTGAISKRQILKIIDTEHVKNEEVPRRANVSSKNCNFEAIKVHRKHTMHAR